MKNLKRLREERNERQEELANEIGTNQSTIHDCELGSRGKRTIALLLKLADHYDVSVDYLIGRTDIRNALTAEELQLAYKIKHLQDPEVAEYFTALIDKYEEITKKKS